MASSDQTNSNDAEPASTTAQTRSAASDGPVEIDALELFTDLYELTMMRAYFELGMTDRGVFSLFVRKLPPSRNFFLACGVSAAVSALEGLRFRRESLDYLATLDGRFPDPFLRHLETFRFTGDVRAVAEGTPVFPHEPLLEISAPLLEGQLVETLVMNLVGLETMLASKAARVVAAADGRLVADFGSRRAHGIDSAVRGARAFYVGGVAGTSNLLAAQRYGLPVYGTVAHSFIEAFPTEEEAFRAFASIYPGTTLLVDTYDTATGVRRIIDLSARLGPAFNVAAVRLDSGDLRALAAAARAELDAAGLDTVKIFVSGGLDERRVAELLADGAPIDGFGVGTDMSVSRDAPALDIVYKLTEYAGAGRMKMAPGKQTLPGPKQVFRRADAAGGRYVGDMIARADETAPGEPLLSSVMRDGRATNAGAEPLEAIRARAAQEISRLPDAIRGLDAADPPYPVAISARLAADEERLRAEIAARGA